MKPNNNKTKTQNKKQTEKKEIAKPRYKVDGKRLFSSSIETQLGMSIEEYCNCNLSWR